MSCYSVLINLLCSIGGQKASHIIIVMVIIEPILDAKNTKYCLTCFTKNFTKWRDNIFICDPNGKAKTGQVRAGQGRARKDRAEPSLPDIVFCIQLSPWEGARMLQTGTR